MSGRHAPGRPPPTPADLARLRDRAAALAVRQFLAAPGASKYEALKPCRRGHLPVRYVSNGACVECTYERKARRNA